MPLNIGVSWVASEACSWIGAALAVEGEAGRAQGRTVQVQIKWAKYASLAVVAGPTVDVTQLALIVGCVEVHIAKDAFLARIAVSTVGASESTVFAGFILSQVETCFALFALNCSAG